jgi:hypothetical protein
MGQIHQALSSPKWDPMARHHRSRCEGIAHRHSTPTSPTSLCVCRSSLPYAAFGGSGSLRCDATFTVTVGAGVVSSSGGT